MSDRLEKAIIDAIINHGSGDSLVFADQDDVLDYVKDNLESDTCEWLCDHREPEDVFSREDLFAWARAQHKDMDELFEEDDIVAHVAKNFADLVEHKDLAAAVAKNVGMLMCIPAVAAAVLCWVGESVDPDFVYEKERLAKAAGLVEDWKAKLRGLTLEELFAVLNEPKVVPLMTGPAVPLVIQQPERDEPAR